MATVVEPPVEKKEKRPSTSHLKAVPETRELRDRVRAEAHAFGKTLDRSKALSKPNKFTSPFNENESLMMSPEESINIQNAIGADIVMQLDDVVKTTTTGPRVEEAMLRTIRWIDRCIEAHTRNDEQSIFPIVQGGLNPELRKQCAEELLKRDVRGFAVGGLSGGESKDEVC